MNRRGKNCAYHHSVKGHSSKSSSRKISPPIPSTKNPNILKNVIKYSGSKIVKCRNLHPTEEMYSKIANLITNDSIVIENIVEVKNPFLKKAYQLKKLQKKKEFGDVYESLVFHGTKKAYVDNICTHNFNWRLYGTSNGHKYGKGVSFSTNAKYASWYSDPNEYHKVMIVAKVLIANVCQGDENMEYPPPGYDTSQKGDDGVVIVKYEDNEFYPAYKLYYHIEENGYDDENDYYEEEDYWGEDEDYGYDYDYDDDYGYNEYDYDYDDGYGYEYDYDYDDDYGYNEYDYDYDDGYGYEYDY